MKYKSVFEIIGPIMVGPSSSHTAGAVRIGNLARQILKQEPKQVEFRLMGSFAETYQGHGTDLALLAGLLGFATDDLNIPKANEKALEAGLEYSFKKTNIGFYHPNTVAIDLKGSERQVKMVASSLGGGKVEVQELDGLPTKFTGENPTLILYHDDVRGFLAKISRFLDDQGYNIGRLALERWRRGGPAVTICEVDTDIPSQLLEKLIQVIPQLRNVLVVQTR